VPTSFSIVRASCLRTLSFETLPRAPATASHCVNPQFASHYNQQLLLNHHLGQQPLSSTTPTTPFVTTHSAGSAASGGPIFFGDPLAGYTTAYIFRIPDVHARGHKRVYAFLALSTHRERLAMKTFGFVAAAFRDLASWIQRLAEAEAERAAEATSPIAGPGAGPFGSLASPHGVGGPDRDVPAERPASSFLSGGSAFTRRMAGAGGGGLHLKQRGLAELVGLPDFFIELHRRFVTLQLELGVMLSS
jgi:hypothetical protein